MREFKVQKLRDESSNRSNLAYLEKFFSLDGSLADNESLFITHNG